MVVEMAETVEMVAMGAVGEREAEEVVERAVAEKEVAERAVGERVAGKRAEVRGAAEWRAAATRVTGTKVEWRAAEARGETAGCVAARSEEAGQSLQNPKRTWQRRHTQWTSHRC